MAPVLGEAQWQDFLAHATARYKRAFAGAFDPPSGVLKCVGRADGAACPHGFEVDFASPRAIDMLEHLHVDHEQDVQITCDMWRAARPSAAASWDDGIDGALLCHLLFGVDEHPVHGAQPCEDGPRPEYCSTFVRRWWPSIVRIVPERLRMTSECVTAPPPR